MRPPDMPENLPNVWIAVEINRDRPAPLKRLPVRQACGKICRDLATFTLRATKTAAPLPSIKRLEGIHREARDLIQSDESLRERAMAALARARNQTAVREYVAIIPWLFRGQESGQFAGDSLWIDHDDRILVIGPLDPTSLKEPAG